MKRRAVAQVMKDHEVSERRACSLANLDRTTFQYEKKRGGDEVLRERLRALAGERRRFGYRRLGILLAQEGHHANHKKLYRIYAEEKLAVRLRKGRKRAFRSRRPMVMPTRPNERWSLDFVSDSLSGGRRFRILCVVDDFTREALAVMPDFSISGVRLARELDAIIARRGKPQTIVSDNVLHSDTQASCGRISSFRSFQIRALKSIAGWASATMEELSAIANTGSMRSVVSGPHRP